MKKTIKLIVALVAVFLIFKLCTSNVGSVINLPGGLGESNTSTGTTDSDGSGGWFSPKKSTTTDTKKSDNQDIEDLEKELGIGVDNNTSVPSTTSSTSSSTTTASSSTPLTFKGIPITGSLSNFGTQLVRAGFSNAGNGTYTGEFAGYSGCKVTPTGTNPVKEVRVDFPVISNWDSLEKAYDSLQASLTQKYGIEPVTSKNNNLAIYNLPNGTITLDADVANQSTWHVILKYANSASSTSLPGTLGKNPMDDL